MNMRNGVHTLAIANRDSQPLQVSKPQRNKMPVNADAAAEKHIWEKKAIGPRSKISQQTAYRATSIQREKRAACSRLKKRSTSLQNGLFDQDNSCPSRLQNDFFGHGRKSRSVFWKAKTAQLRSKTSRWLS